MTWEIYAALPGVSTSSSMTIPMISAEKALEEHKERHESRIRM